MSNNELRRRKLKNEGNRPAGLSKRRKDASGPTLHTSFLCLIASATILTVFVLLYTDDIPWHLGNRAIDHLAKQFGYHKPVHAVVVDAGSTGSRVLAFTFHESFLGGKLVLDKELFEYTKPGLSSFADAPQKAVQSISNLLDLAKDEIPKEFWAKTPLILKATAGLRLLPPAKATTLLDSVKQLFGSAPFLTTDKSVEIMDGTDEGIFSWFTVNFLLEKINGNPSKTVAALDLGGGSTQVTFSALTPASLQQKEYIHQAVAPNGRIPVFTHSFLGLGLMAARKEVLTFKQPNQVNVTSECVNHIVQNRKFHFGGTDFFVSGPLKDYAKREVKSDQYSVGQEVPVVNSAKCTKLVSDYVLSKAKPPAELPTKEIFAFSYYFDRAAEVGLIDETKGGRVKVNDFKKAAETSCNEANADQPFMCLDLTFISVLLEKGFGLRGDTTINLYKKINGHEISWALGAAYDLLRG